MSRVLCYGVVGVDYLLTIKSYPDADGHARIRSESVQIGGEAANTAVRLAQLGVDVTLMGNPVGTDSDGERLKKEIGCTDVDFRIETLKGRTGHAYVISDDEGHRTILGAFGELRGSSVTEAEWEGVGLATVDPFVEGSTAVAKSARARGLPVVSIEVQPNHDLARLSTIVILSSGMIHRHGCDEPRVVAEALLKQGVEIAIVTRGAEGAAVYTVVGSSVVRPIPTDVVDSTGAGDAFRAGLIAGLIEDRPLEAALRLAAAAASISCRFTGGCGGNVTRRDALSEARLT